MSADNGLSQSPKPDGAQFSFRPQRPSKKSGSVSSPTPPATITPSSSDVELNGSTRDPPGVPYVERPTDEKAGVFTRSWLLNHRLSESVDPEGGILSKMKSSMVYRASSSASNLPLNMNSSREGQQRDRRGSNGPRNARSGSASTGSSNSSYSTGGNNSLSSGAGNASNVKSRGGSGSGSHLAQPLAGRNGDGEHRDSSPSGGRGRGDSQSGRNHRDNSHRESPHGSYNSTSSTPGMGNSLSSSPAPQSSMPRFLSTRMDSNRLPLELLGLLNKLTFEKFDSLSEQITRKFESVETVEVFTECVKLFHSKSLQEHTFCAMYADLAKMLDKVYAFEAAQAAAAIPSTSTTPTPATVTVTAGNGSSAPIATSTRTSTAPIPATTSAALSRVDQIRTDAGASGFMPSPSSSPANDAPISSQQHYRSVSPSRPRSESGSSITVGSPSGTSSMAASNSSGSLAKPRPVGMFRKLLLNNCYYVWQEGMDSSQTEDFSSKARHRVRVNMTFMAELYKHGLMPIRVLKSSADGLVAHIREQIATNQHALAELHCLMLYHLIKTGGEQMDKDKLAKPLLETCMEALKEFASQKGFQLRLHFLLRDVIDDRLNEWRPRRRYDGPMKLEDLKELHEADLINPVVFTTSERVFTPSSDFDDKPKQVQANQARQSISPAKRGGKERSGSGTKGNMPSRRSGSGGASSSVLPFGAIKEPSGYVPSPTSPAPQSIASPTSTTQAVDAHGLMSPGNPLSSVNWDRMNNWPTDLVSAALTDPEENLEPLVAHFNKNPSSNNGAFVSKLLSWLLDRSRTDQAKLSQLLQPLVKLGILSSSDITQGFTFLVQTLDDLTMDVPQAPGLLGKRVAELVSSNVAILSPEQRSSIVAHCPQKFSPKFAAEANAEI